MNRPTLLFSKVAFAAILLFLGSSTALAQVTYTLTGTLSLVSGMDPFGLNGQVLTITATLSQVLPPSSVATTTTSSSNSYSGVTAAVNLGGLGAISCSAESTPPVTVTLTDNVGAPDTFVIAGCDFIGLSQIYAHATIPNGYMITAIPAAIPSTVNVTSGSFGFLLSGSPTPEAFELTNATLTATGTPPPGIIPSPTALTPLAPLGSTTPISQNVTFFTAPYAAESFSTSVTTTDGGNWLSVSPAAANTGSAITIKANPKGLTQPSYSGTVILTYGPDYATTSIPVTFTLTPTALPPSVSFVSPNTGQGVGQTFAAGYSDPYGVSELSDVLILFNTSVQLSAACAVVYVPRTNEMYLYNDAGTGFSAGVTPGNNADVSNSQCTLEGAGSYFSASGTTVILTASLAFSGTFVGSKNIYLDAVGKENSSGWVKEGTWTPSSLGPPSVGSLSPSTGAGSTQTFTAVYSDPDGLADLTDVVILFNSSLKVSSACEVIYVPETNQLYLDNDAGTGLTAGITPGSSASVSNSQCTLTGTESSFSTSGDSLTLNVALTFSGTFVGLKNGYLHAVGKTQSSGWIQEGAWTP